MCTTYEGTNLLGNMSVLGISLSLSRSPPTPAARALSLALALSFFFALSLARVRPLSRSLSLSLLLSGPCTRSHACKRIPYRSCSPLPSLSLLRSPLLPPPFLLHLACSYLSHSFPFLSLCNLSLSFLRSLSLSLFLSLSLTSQPFLFIAQTLLLPISPPLSLPLPPPPPPPPSPPRSPSIATSICQKHTEI